MSTFGVDYIGESIKGEECLVIDTSSRVNNQFAINRDEESINANPLEG